MTSRIGLIAATIAAAFVMQVTRLGAETPPAGKVCEKLVEHHLSYTVCSVDKDAAGLRLFLRDPDGSFYGTFAAVDRDLASKGERLVFAMNAGMYRKDRMPAGLYVEDGRQVSHLNARNGYGNFHLKPNGVFWIGADGAHVTETTRYAAQKPQARYATQSGPMLVIGGKLHPKFHAQSESRKIRNGVGTCRDGRVRFAISNEPVTFHAFASLFRDRLGCADALFLDGSISALHAPGLGRSDFWLPLGPIVGLVAKKN